MKISAISDIHIKKVGDEAYELLMSFLSRDEVKSSDKILLLGDIFDLMVANKKQYIKKFQRIFDRLDELTQQGVEIHFFEGNHDFNLERIFTKFFSANFFYHKEGHHFQLSEGVTLYCSHGDEVDIEDLAYIKWKKLCSSKIFRFILNYIFPFRFIEYLGDKMSQASRNKGSKSFDYDKVKARFEPMILNFAKSLGANYIIVGHNHIESEYAHFTNNGFCPKTKKFSYIEDGKLELRSIL